LFLNSATHAFESREAGSIRIEAPRLAKHVRILFSDDGRVMSDEVLRRAFEPFFTTRRGQGGSGLGLNIVYNLVMHQLGGRVTVKSEEGQGALFEMIIPLQAPAASSPTTDVADRPARTSSAA